MSLKKFNFLFVLLVLTYLLWPVWPNWYEEMLDDARLAKDRSRFKVGRDFYTASDGLGGTVRIYENEYSVLFKDGRGWWVGVKTFDDSLAAVENISWQMKILQDAPDERFTRLARRERIFNPRIKSYYKAIQKL